MNTAVKAVLLMLGLMLAACTDSTPREIHLLSGASPAELARSHLAGAVLEQHGYDVTIEQVRLGKIWQQLWAGNADASLSVWLPEASAPFVERFFERLHDLGPKDGGLASEAGFWPSGDRPHTLVRRSLEQDAPEAFAILQALHWQPEDIEQIMANWQQSQDWQQAARSWLAAHPVDLDLVQQP